MEKKWGRVLVVWAYAYAYSGLWITRSDANVRSSAVLVDVLFLP